jgi:hypothetical protein
MRCVEADEFETAVQIEEQVEGEVKLHACTRKVYYYSFEGEDAFGRKIPGATLGVRVLFPLPFERGKLYKVELT